MPSDCVFCTIAASPDARLVYADAQAVAFLDFQPRQRGHVIVAPRRHSEDVVADPTALAECQAAVAHLAPLLVERLGADGLNLLSSAGNVAGQEVMHTHLHLIPRYQRRPGLRALFVGEPAQASDAELDDVYRALTS